MAQRRDDYGPAVGIVPLTWAAAARPLPKAPVLSWDSLWGRRLSSLPSVGDLPHVAYASSGRAALLAALRQTATRPGSGVLVPTYHCPTMVAPVLRAGLQPLFFPVTADGLPELDAIGTAMAGQARVMFVAHYFGLPKSLQTVQRWCHERDIVLVEDCAHSYFGQAGERPIGCWGDYATASLSKFFPVAEAGLLASAYHPLKPLGLQAAGLSKQIKGGVDVLEFAQRYGRLAGVSQLLAPLFWLKNGGRLQTTVAALAPSVDASLDDTLASCDMARVEQAATWAACSLHQVMPEARVVQRRRANYLQLAQGLAGAPGAQLLQGNLPEGAAPYVCPLLVEGAERADLVYFRMRQARLPVFRWDQVWPGTPIDSHDHGHQWQRQILQLLCHQDLCSDDLTHVLHATRQFLTRA